MEIIKTAYILLLCHFFGDYVLQSDFLANTKGQNWWHMIAHCVLYTLPFVVAFSFDWRVLFILATHLIIDSLKARWNKINYVQDQILHLIITCVYFI